MTVSVLSAGLGCKCPECGEGRLFNGFSTFKTKCESCGADFSKVDIGDGAAFFVMFAIAIIVTPLLLISEIVTNFSLWSRAVFFSLLTLMLALWMIPPCRALLFALQWKYDAGEARLDDD